MSPDGRHGGVPQRLPDELFLVSRAAAGRFASAGPRPIEPRLGAELFAGGRSRAAGALTSARDTEPGLPGAGTVIDKFRLDVLLGVGGFAAVYRATHLLLGTTVALKLLRSRPGRRGTELSEALCAEARFAARIDHPNVVRVYDVTQTPEHTYVVMEYIAGETLDQLIGWRGALPLSTVLRVGLDVAAGLQAGLECQLTHRDIKPRNILVTPEGRAKVIDLGLAHSRAESVYLPAPRGSGRHKVVGTPGYVAPEWVTAPADVDFRADIYSLGITLYYAACGRLPFDATDTGASLTAHCDRHIPPPSHFRPDLPAAFVRSLMRMLERRPASRQPSYRALERELHAILESMHPSSTSSATAAPGTLESRV